ncbi:hypothetical protein BDV12DRAFT_203386 [Aspergillus spectabilis]
MRMKILTSRPVTVLAGQYVNLWVPSLNPWSWFQGSSFVVTSWSADKQRTLHLYAESHQRKFGFKWLLERQAKNRLLHNLTWFTGPHGTSEPVSQYETVLIVASNTGILAVKPYVEQLFHTVKQKISKTRRLHLVWQLSGLGVGDIIRIDMGEWINTLFCDDVDKKLFYEDELKGSIHSDTELKLPGNPMLQISIFDPAGLIGLDVGIHGGRGQVLRGPAEFDAILKEEVRGHRNRRSEDVKGESGEMLVMVSATDGVRDGLQEAVKAHLKWVKFVKLEYQPQTKTKVRVLSEE